MFASVHSKENARPCRISERFARYHSQFKSQLLTILSTLIPKSEFQRVARGENGVCERASERTDERLETCGFTDAKARVRSHAYAFGELARGSPFAESCVSVCRRARSETQSTLTTATAPAHLFPSTRPYLPSPLSTIVMYSSDSSAKRTNSQFSSPFPERERWTVCTDRKLVTNLQD